MDRKELTDYLLTGISGRSLDRLSSLYKDYLLNEGAEKEEYLMMQKPEDRRLIERIDEIEKQYGRDFRKLEIELFGKTEFTDKTDIGFFLPHVRMLKIIFDGYIPKKSCFF